MTNTVSMLGRRNFLKASAAAAAIAAIPGAASAAGGAPDPFTADLAAFADELIRLVPEQATSLGLDKGKYAALKSRLSDVSVAFDENRTTARCARCVTS